jgi:hypothetical protein
LWAGPSRTSLARHVTEVVPGELLRFTVRDVANPRLRPISGRAEDDITQSYRLAGAGGRSVLTTSHGDLAKIADGEALYPLVGELWDRLLPTIKELAERGQRASG